MTTSLFDTHRLGRLTLPNRAVMAPMSRIRGTAEGFATEQMATYFGQRATAGLIISDGTAPNRVGSGNPGAAGLRTEEEAASWKPVTDAVHGGGGRIFAQLMHAGRISHESTSGLQPVGPSAVAANATVFTPVGPRPAPVPRALEISEIPEQARSYAQAAIRAIDAGFDGVELHGANGYLIGQFLSSNANLRTDSYGGSIAGRIRFAVEAAEATADAIGADRTGIRLSPGAGLWDVVEEDVPALYGALLTELNRLGLAYVHLEVTTDEATVLDLRRRWEGTFMVNPSTWLERGGEAYGPVPTNRDSAEHWLGLGADLVSFGRAYLANPDLVERLRRRLPLAEADPATFYTGGASGYVDYPAYQQTA
ncbi:alkene reductase [Tsukamurella sp. 8F]|uniref:alkene reductase n=1 Tax=unclassified Tsukamurella TaxID=2633480 RepID=UPI0023B91C0C|nr:MULTISPECIES: alkene reductase [unclassified Tsukamurella]MDF0531878.1 alkene reductase [Tsukamurella sp. 8J]MDF0589112.1 alkene reductase [Tsukamurella sp. 8F]